MPPTPPTIIDLNADLAEDPDSIRSGRDEAVLRRISSVNIACGGHAGDDFTMRAIVRVAASLGVAIGAHPSYPDRANFGRVEVAMPLDDLRESVRGQILALRRIASESGAAIAHVKPHGALYHAAMRSPEIARAIATAADQALCDPMPGVTPSLAPADLGRSIHASTPPVRASVFFVGLRGFPGFDAWIAGGRRVLAEAFADRAYLPDGSLAPRSTPGAVIDDPDRAATQALDIIRRASVDVIGGAKVAVRADTICIHGDSPRAPEVAGAVRRALEDRGVVVRPPQW